MDDALEELEERILNEYADLVQKAQPALEKHWFYDVMPPWEVFREYRMGQLASAHEE